MILISSNKVRPIVPNIKKHYLDHNFFHTGLIWHARVHKFIFELNFKSR